MHNVCKSAWWPSAKISFARNSVMVPCTFRQFVSVIEGPDVTFLCSEAIETILLPRIGRKAGKSLFKRKTIESLVILGEGH